MIQFAVLLSVTIASAYLAGRIAARKGRSVTTWLWLGAVFGPLGTAAVAVLPTRRRATVA
jgi:ABC-type iron transport system FetAB permease component